MQTVTENLIEMANEIQNLLEDLLLNHSSIYMWNSPDSIVISPRNYAYKKLSEEGRQIQAQLLDKYRNFYYLLSVLLKDQPKDTLRELSQANTRILRTIEQNNTSSRNTKETFDSTIQLLRNQVQLLKRLYDSADGEVTYVPDTNALLYNPDLESWIFPETVKFTVILLPTVLSELDALKVNHRNEDVRKKAEKLIRKIKEYRRRGKLTSGVVLVRDKSKIQALAIEPNMEETLPWLASDNNDDRLLAGIIEVMRFRPRSPVITVSRDINFQNKAEFANIPFVEPPDPV